MEFISISITPPHTHTHTHNLHLMGCIIYCVIKNVTGTEMKTNFGQNVQVFQHVITGK